nr:hypothetical protein [Sphingomonas suaedae]
MRHEQLVLAPAVRHFGELVADWRLEHPKAVKAARTHPVQRLLGVLLALVLIGTGEDILDEAAIAVLAELVRGRYHDRAGAFDGGAELLVRDDIAGKARQVVYDYEVGLLLATQKFEHGLHFRPVGFRAGIIVAEDANDEIVVALCIFAAAGFLTVEAMAIGLLFGVGHTAVDHRLLSVDRVGHVSFFPAASSWAAPLKSSCAVCSNSS